ncbi:MAG: gamma-glutamylcyclotransferase family protein [Thermodesulfobacteriota bacterium]
MACLAVYGTLKSNQANHRLLSGAEFIGYGVSVEKYPMTDNEHTTYPFLFEAPGVGCQVKMEVYDVGEQTLKQLDIYEGVHAGLYYRGKIKIDIRGKIIPCICYFCSDLTGYRKQEFLREWGVHISEREQDS